MLRRSVWLWLLTVTGCATPSVPHEFAAELATAPGDTSPRLLLAGNKIVVATTPLFSAHELPRPVAQMAMAIAPDGERTFVGREWGPRGEGYRIDCRYTDPPHVRSMLLTAGGQVLERSHTVPIAEVPQPVLAAALQTGPLVDAAAIVSGPEREEYWLVQVRDRSNKRFVVQIGLDGRERARHRRFSAQLDG
jgi:hypothetical protein